MQPGCPDSSDKTAVCLALAGPFLPDSEHEDCSHRQPESLQESHPETGGLSLSLAPHQGLPESNASKLFFLGRIKFFILFVFFSLNSIFVKKKMKHTNSKIVDLIKKIASIVWLEPI